MKKLFLIIALAFLLLPAISQPTSTKGYHQFSSPNLLSTCSITGTPTGAAPTPINSGWKFKIVNIVPAGYVIHILFFKATTPAAAILNSTYSRNAAGIDIYYLLSRTDYLAFCVGLESKASLTVGSATSILKLRPGSKRVLDGKYPIYFDFGNDLSFGLLTGIKLKSRRVDALAAHNIVTGFSISSIDLTTETTRGFLTSNSNSSAVTFPIGYVYEYDRFQLGLFMAWDVMSGEEGKKWVYRGRPWYGLNFGYSIFKTQGSGSQPSQKND